MGNGGFGRDREEISGSERVNGEKEKKAEKDCEKGRCEEEGRFVRDFSNGPRSRCGGSLWI